MRRFVRGPAPPCLITLIEDGQATWRAVTGDQKQQMRTALCRDQNHLCAYCETRLLPDDAKRTTVEHWVPRGGIHGDRGKMFAWDNLLGVCEGAITGENKLEELDEMPHHPETTSDKRPYHCDNFRGKLLPERQKLYINPGIPGASIPARFDIYGRIWSDAPYLQADIKTLNLNAWRVRQNRKAAFDDLLRTVGKVKRIVDLEQELERLQIPDKHGRLKPYVSMQIYQLKKRINIVRGRNATK